MKRIYLYGMLLVVLFAGACSDDVYDHEAAAPQSYPQETEQSVDGFTFALGAGVTSPIVLTEEDLEKATALEAVTTTATPELAEGAYLTFKLEASDTKEFTSSIELPSTSDNNTVTVTAPDLDEAVKSLYGKAPNARELYLRANYYIVDGTISVLMPTPVVLGPVTVTPVAPVIETEYYLIGDVNGWGFDKLDQYKFDHSGKDVYEDPIFTLLVEIPSGSYFKIVPKSSKEAGSWDGVLGNPTDGNTALEGELIVEKAQAMRIEEPGWARITLNMMEYTYSIQLLGYTKDVIYMTGDAITSLPGWKNETAQLGNGLQVLFADNSTADSKYTFTAHFTGGKAQKFPVNAGVWNPCWGYKDGALVLEDNSPNLSGPATDGYYTLKLDFGAKTAEYMPYTGNVSVTYNTMGVIGTATAGGWDADTDLTQVTDHIWTGNAIELKAGELKIRANDAWEVSWGPASEEEQNSSFGLGTTANGKNIIIETAGTYYIALNDLTGHYIVIPTSDLP
ncbi:Outer membrane protein SusF domain-containing protein [Limibacterium fermenti]|uniref:Outer membrane protein SusF domain-containing protein n=1 Tax=Limibacterium fermenti TaxID=3229863 RepID=UPI000E8F39D2|nr:hypothetical protein [Porphyromonadaceae bacterium]